MDRIYNKLLEYPLVKALDDDENLESFSLVEEALSIVVSYLKNPRQIIIIKPNFYQAEQLYNQIASFINKVEIFMVEESLRIEHIASSPEYLANRLSVLTKLLNRNDLIVVTHTAAVLRFLPDVDLFKKSTINLKVNDEIEMKDLQYQLIQSGYHMTQRVDQPLTFSIRGGVVDVFSINHEKPVRIEFFDTEVETIRFFELDTQLTVEKTEEITIIPATDIIFSVKDKETIGKKTKVLLKQNKKHPFYKTLENKTLQNLEYLKENIITNEHYFYYPYVSKKSSLLDYGLNPQIIYASYKDFTRNQQKIELETNEYIKEKFEIGESFLVTELHHKESLLQHPFIDLGAQFKTSEIYDLIHPIDIPFKDFNYIMDHVINQSKKNIVILILEESEIKEVINYLLNKHTEYQIYDENKELSNGIYISKGNLFKGFYYQNLWVYSNKEIFNNALRTTRYSKKFKEAELIDDIGDLKKGDYIVHNNYGVGQYLGIITREMKGVQRDFLKITYRNNDELLVPLQQFNLVRKFVSREGVAPRLNKLGSNEWAKTKERLSQNVDDLAERLVELYSMRTINEGYAFKRDDELEELFAKEIDFTLTNDQEQAIKEIEQDMMSSKPMDRLLSGDVGFGKTEVSMRAAFKAVYNGKQVAFLCPTTILSGQHFETFKTRFHGFPVNIAVINRFVSDRQQKKIIEKLKNKEIDILIGTHRILSQDIQFKDLGLLIIDEEQRFGVEHKEKIKEIKTSVDVLSLSATPIPRTMQMSLVGIRSLSQLTEAPKNRQPIQTYVIERNRKITNEVIQREVAREGQVYYLHNNVDNLNEIAYKLNRDMPELRIGIVHGQMDKEHIENVMIEFTLHEYDVLVCTTIIETGIDIANANTILIDNADTFGLSQLYQIRGRVGRGDRIAYCYLMYTPQKQLTEIAQKRLDTIKEFTQLGSGYKIAMRDLTIRGAGDMLGPEQSGFIDTVGIDMYLEMLNQAIKEKSGQEIEEEKEEKIKIETKGHIPKTFTHYDLDKIKLYQDIDSVKSLKSLKELYEKTTDLYGTLPKDVDLIFESKQLELLINDAKIHEYRERNKYVDFSFTEDFSNQVDGVKLFQTVSDLSPKIAINYTDKRINFKIPKNNNWINDIITIIDSVNTKGERYE